MNVFGLWEEIRVSRENPHRHIENMQKKSLSLTFLLQEKRANQLLHWAAPPNYMGKNSQMKAKYSMWFYNLRVKQVLL